MAAMSTQELADHFGVAEPTVRKWTRRLDFPPSLGWRPNPLGIRGRFPEVWDSKAVARWKRERVHGNTRGPLARRVVELERRLQRERARRTLVRKIRARAIAGAVLRAIAADLGVSYSFVRSVTADIKPPNGWRRRYSDEELLEAVKVSRARRSHADEQWRETHRYRVPCLQTITHRFGSWSAAVTAAAEAG